jgi:hypothetical protein
VKKVELQKVKRRRPRKFLSILPGALLFLISMSIAYKYPPEGTINLQTLTVPVLPLFIVVFGSSLFFLGAFLKDRLQGLIIGCFFIVYVVLSTLKLNSLFFIVLLFALLIVAELFIYKKSDIRS